MYVCMHVYTHTHRQAREERVVEIERKQQEDSALFIQVKSAAQKQPP
jgi:hypothetical protein